MKSTNDEFEPVSPVFDAESTALDVVRGLDLGGRSALVTGASSGIGVETARALAAAGASVTLAVRDVTAGSRTAEDIRSSTGNTAVRVAHLDLADLARRASGLLGVRASARNVRIERPGEAESLPATGEFRRVLQILVNPNIAFLLLLVGIIGIAIELFSPGLIIPGTLGVVCFLLGAFGTSQLPVTAVGIALLVVGIAMIIAEAHLPTNGIVGVIGAVALVASRERSSTVQLLTAPLPPHPTSRALGRAGADTKAVMLPTVARPFLVVSSASRSEMPDCAATGFWPGTTFAGLPSLWQR